MKKYITPNFELNVICSNDVVTISGFGDLFDFGGLEFSTGDIDMETGSGS